MSNSNHFGSWEANDASWEPDASISTLKRRAEFLRDIRDFFNQRGVMEVETPILSSSGNTSPHVESFSTHYSGPDARMLYLHTSPEFPMKRLLAAGSGPIFQIAKVFRNGELGRLHNPEFTMLEWYRPGLSYMDLMEEVAELVKTLCGQCVSAPLTYAQLFESVFEIDIHEATPAQLIDIAMRRGMDIHAWSDEIDVDFWRDLLMTHFIEPNLGKDTPVFVYDYPASQAALARLKPDDKRIAERFELYWQGVEIANGYRELTDAGEQRKRFQAEQQQRSDAQSQGIPIDENLCSALKHMPECSGVALGVDRLFMLHCGQKSIEKVLSFAITKA